jgi:hypothetical protein
MCELLQGNVSQNDEYFNRRGVTKRSCGCTSMFHFENFSISSTLLTVQNTDRKSILPSCNFYFSYNFASSFHVSVTGDASSHFSSPLSTCYCIVQDLYTFVHIKHTSNT